MRRRSTLGDSIENRDGHRVSAPSAEVTGSRSPTSFDTQSRFAVLGDLGEDVGLPERINVLKQKILEIPGPSGLGGKAHARPAKYKGKAP